MTPGAKPSRMVHAVCAYWLMSSDGSSAETAGGQNKRLSVLIVIRASAAFIRDVARLTLLKIVAGPRLKASHLRQTFVITKSPFELLRRQHRQEHAAPLLYQHRLRSTLSA